jgi:hypothetical protein
MPASTKLLPPSTRIAGRKTVADWLTYRPTLMTAADSNAWTLAFDDFFYQRLDARYFRPIKLLDETYHHFGEGFSIMALHCSTIEFLGATMEGKRYKYDPGGRKTDAATEYNKSREMFEGFLTTAPPFNASFSEAAASAFYEHIRCPLLHEARTSGGWTIRVGGSGELADFDKKIVWRNRFPMAFKKFCGWYRQELSANEKYQQAFVRKFDALCEE